MTGEPVCIFRQYGRPRVLEADGTISRRLGWAVSALLAASLGYYHWTYEGWHETIIFAGGITTALAATLMLLSRRLLFSVAMVTALVTIIVISSSVKRQFFDMVLHAYDVVFYLTSVSTLQFLWVDHRAPLLALATSLVATAAVGWWLYGADRSRVPRSISAAVLAVALAAATWAGVAKGGRAHTLFYWNNLYLSSFYASWAETFETLWKGQLLDALASQNKPPFKIPATCALKEPPPHVILIHQESVVPPGLFPSLKYDPSLDPFFKSFDGKLHKLRVETYGGASWLTEFSVIAGVSTYSFGGMRTFVQSLMQGKVHDTLPQALERCGYDNAVFYPVLKGFVSNGKFYAAAGMPTIFDSAAQGAKRFNERDKFYYNNALKHLEQQIANSTAPTFTFLLTSATHLPYNRTYEPQVDVAGGGPGTPPEMNEYLRRLAMAKMDFDAFKSELAARFPKERFLIVQYGDHQPITTRTLLGFAGDQKIEDMEIAPDSLGFLTYYRVDGVNYAPSPLPEVEALDVPYLSSLVLKLAGLPLSGSHTERLRLMDVCAGRYFTCPKQRQILGFHRRLIDSGIVEAR